MDRQTFCDHFELATRQAVEFARQYVTDELTGPVRFLVIPNQSLGSHPHGREVVFPQDSLPEGRHLGPWTANEVVTFLWRDGRVPAWIDIAVVARRWGVVHVRLLCCARFTDDDAQTYYKWTDRPPFGVKSPNLPPHRVEGTKCALDWRRPKLRVGLGRVCFVASTAAVALFLLCLWLVEPPRMLARLLGACLVVTAASGSWLSCSSGKLVSKARLWSKQTRGNLRVSSPSR